jgi:hypothetical protein
MAALQKASPPKLDVKLLFLSFNLLQPFHLATLEDVKIFA